MMARAGFKGAVRRRMDPDARLIGAVELRPALGARAGEVGAVEARVRQDIAAIRLQAGRTVTLLYAPIDTDGLGILTTVGLRAGTVGCKF